MKKLRLYNIFNESFGPKQFKAPTVGIKVDKNDLISIKSLIVQDDSYNNSDQELIFVADILERIGALLKKTKSSGTKGYEILNLTIREYEYLNNVFMKLYDSPGAKQVIDKLNTMNPKHNMK